MAACFVNAHSIMDTPHFSGDVVHGARNRNGLTQFPSNNKPEQLVSISSYFAESANECE